MFKHFYHLTLICSLRVESTFRNIVWSIWYSDHQRAALSDVEVGLDAGLDADLEVGLDVAQIVEEKAESSVSEESSQSSVSSQASRCPLI